ncbi:hypothetical protein WJX73_004241 [Symbiochloris irregularis]|uniref:Uncharacterized protein n=1 Tax=Symbiochloris irregularis TaxID=706552 RepID=A0AAW1PLD9_9CHLO
MPTARIEAPTVYRTLRTWQVYLFTAALPICFITFIVASVGTYTLTDPEGQTALGRSDFAKQWRRLLEWNPMSNAMLFNGSMFTFIWANVQLHKHRKAKRIEAGEPVDTRSRQERRQSDRDQKKLT